MLGGVTIWPLLGIVWVIRIWFRAFHSRFTIYCSWYVSNSQGTQVRLAPYFAFWRRVLSYLFTYCYIMDRFLFILLYFDRASNAPSWIRLVNSSEAEIQVSVATYDAHTYSPKGLTRFVRQVHILVFQISLADLLCWKFTKSIDYPRTKLNLKEASLDICASNNRHPKFQCTYISYEASCLLHSFWEQ